MHLSHLSEDITTFYRADPAQRAEWLLGHGFAISRRTGLRRTTLGHDGRSYPANAGLIQRSYASTTENPFSWSGDHARDHWRAEPAAGLHFVAFSATSNIFHQYRFAMDARDDRGRPLPANVGHDRDVASHAFNRLVQASHRQNFLVPPRARRSFPLVELL
jgi:hypothetical protein